MVHHVTLRDHGDSFGVTIPMDMLRHAGLVEDGQLVFAEGETPQVFVHYDPESREVSFTLPDPPADHPRDERADGVQEAAELTDGERRALQQDD